MSQYSSNLEQRQFLDRGSVSLSSLLTASLLTTLIVSLYVALDPWTVLKLIRSPLATPWKALTSFNTIAFYILLYLSSTIILSTRSSRIILHKTPVKSRLNALFRRIWFKDILINIAFSFFVASLFKWCGFVNIPLYSIETPNQINNAYIFVFIFTLSLPIIYTVQSSIKDDRTVIIPTINRSLYFRTKSDFLQALSFSMKYSALFILAYLAVYAVVGLSIYKYVDLFASYFADPSQFRFQKATDVIVKKSLFQYIRSFFTIPKSIPLIKNVTISTLNSCFCISIAIIAQLESIKLLISNFRSVSLSEGQVPIRSLVSYLDGNRDEWYQYRSFLYLKIQIQHDLDYKKKIYSEIDPEPSSWELVGGACLRTIDNAYKDVHKALLTFTGSTLVKSEIQKAAPAAESSNKFEKKDNFAKMTNVQRVRSLDTKKTYLKQSDKSTIKGAISNLMDVLDKYVETYIRNANKEPETVNKIPISSSNIPETLRKTEIPKVLQHAGRTSALNLRHRNVPNTKQLENESKQSNKGFSGLSKKISLFNKKETIQKTIEEMSCTDIIYILEVALRNEQIISWALQSLTNLVIGAPELDRYGIVSHDVPVIIETYLKLYIEVERLINILPRNLKRSDSIPSTSSRYNLHFNYTSHINGGIEFETVSKLYGLFDMLEISIHQIAITFYNHWKDLKINSDYSDRLQKFVDIRA